MKKKQSNGKKAFIYFRYIFGVALALLIFAGMFIPCLKYNVGGNSNQPISTVSLMKNSWETSRVYLFDGGANKVVEQTSFSKALLGTLILLVVLFVIGAAFAVYTAYCALSYIKDPKSVDKADKNRILFLTLAPNRVVICLYSALLLPLAFLPRIIVPLYENILNYQTVLFPNALEPWIIALVLYAAFVAIVFISAKYEKQFGLDPLYNEVKEKLRREKKRVMTYAEEQDEESEDTGDTVLSIDDILREEQAARIRKMFSDDDPDNK